MKIIDSKPLRGTLHTIEDNGSIDRYFRLTSTTWFKEICDECNEWEEVPWVFKIKELEELYQSLKLKWEVNF